MKSFVTLALIALLSTSYTATAYAKTGCTSPAGGDMLKAKNKAGKNCFICDRGAVAHSPDYKPGKDARGTKIDQTGCPELK